METHSFSGTDYRFMARALQLAERGLFTTDPNPRVGCVLVKHDKIIGEGWHEWAGQAHAEVNALDKATEDVKGATAYVTLEPCSHHGRTSPCADALVQAGVSKVIAASKDPNPEVNESGFRRLRDGGIEVLSGLCEEQAVKLNRGFFKRMRAGHPWVTIKLAATLDGRTAAANGESQWITGEAARKDVHKLRARSSAVLTGIGTVLADNPRLTARFEDVCRQPARVVLDNRLRISQSAELFDSEGQVFIFTSNDDAETRQVLEQKGAHVFVHSKFIDLQQLLTQLAEQEMNEILVESGARLAGAIVERSLADQLVLYLAPNLLGKDGEGLFNLPLLKRLKDKVELNITDIRMLGKDLRITAAFSG